MLAANAFAARPSNGVPMKKLSWGVGKENMNSHRQFIPIGPNPKQITKSKPDLKGRALTWYSIVHEARTTLTYTTLMR